MKTHKNEGFEFVNTKTKAILREFCKKTFAVLLIYYDQAVVVEQEFLGFLNDSRSEALSQGEIGYCQLWGQYFFEQGNLVSEIGKRKGVQNQQWHVFIYEVG